MAGLYVHIPFCRRKCIYCDFYSVGERLAVWPDFVIAILKEAEERLGECDGDQINTLYFGGGTPSLLPPEEFRRLSEGLSAMTGPVDEFTIEVNPDDVTSQSARIWKECGVNRVSVGVQSMVDSELEMIGRRHNASGAQQAFEILRHHFDNISLDLMFGLPGQIVKSWAYSIDRILEFSPEHISAYSLMYEERTAITRMRDTGKILETSESEIGEMFDMLTSKLETAGYEQYEISNYARSGFRSRHNSSYWRGEKYLGLGPAAHSYDGDRYRCANKPDIRAYMNYWLRHAGENPVVEELLTDDELREEMIMTRLRTREGIDLEEFCRRFGERELALLRRRAARWIAAGKLKQSAALSLTRAGIMISDEIISDLF